MTNVSHPLQFLSSSEIATIKTVIDKPDIVYNYMGILDPSKESVVNFENGGALESRIGFVIYTTPTTSIATEVFVNLLTNRIEFARDMPAGYVGAGYPFQLQNTDEPPGSFLDDLQPFKAALWANETIQTSLKRRGVMSEDQFAVAGSNVSIRQFKNDRNATCVLAVPGQWDILTGVLMFLVNTDAFVYEDAEKYAIPGMAAQISYEGEVIEFVDLGLAFDPEPIPRNQYVVTPGAMTNINSFSDNINIHVTDGFRVKWHMWDFMIIGNTRVGVTIRRIHTTHEGTRRSIFDRISPDEVFIPYGGTSPEKITTNYRDFGDLSSMYGTLMTLRPNFNVPTTSKFIDIPLTDISGNLQIVPAAVALFEVDDGIRLNHPSSAPAVTPVEDFVRPPKLSVYWFYKLGKYCYEYTVGFRLDGSIHVQTKAIGLDHFAKTNNLDNKIDGGQLIAPQVYALNHQHLFMWRIEPAIDGVGTTHSCSHDSLPIPSPCNNGIQLVETEYKTPQESVSRMNFETYRNWCFMSHTSRNRMGKERAYCLRPGMNTVALARKDAASTDNNEYLKWNFSTTSFNPYQEFSASWYPGYPTDIGLGKWINDNKSISHVPIVCWYMTGFTHIPSSEDWIYMPSVETTFTIVPFNFYNYNPLLDVAFVTYDANKALSVESGGFRTQANKNTN